MKQLLILILLFSVPLKADISQYQLETSETLSGYSELSDIAMIDGVEHYVDDGSGVAAGCLYGGDPEALAQYQPGKIYVVNEAKAGLAVVNLSDCSIERRILTGLQSGSSGIEGIEVYNNEVYLLEEDGDLYKFTDNGDTNVSPTYLFSFLGCDGCGGLGMRANGNFLAISGPETASGRVLEYDQNGNYISELPISLTNGEGVMENSEGKIVVVGEPNHRVVYSGNSTPDVIISCETTVVTVMYNQTQDKIEAPTSVPLAGEGCSGYTGTIQ